jgi:ubiquinone/menaquinone biosynthesis C-methylase UbiE
LSASSEIDTQSRYWNSEAEAFSSIYSHEKSAFGQWLDRTFRQDMYERYEFTLAACEPVAGRSFLDVGCGNGLYSVELARRGAGSVVGLDIAEGMLERCRKAAAAAGVQETCSFVHSDLLNYEPDGTFDVSFGIGLFDYISDPLPVLAKMRAVTSGSVIAAFPRLGTWRAPVRKARLAVKGCPVYFYSRRKVDRLLREAGFQSHAVTTVGKLFCVVAE